MVLITLSSFLSVTVINIYMREDQNSKVPSWLRKVGDDAECPLIGSRPSDHYLRSVCLSVCAEFFSAIFDPI